MDQTPVNQPPAVDPLVASMDAPPKRGGGLLVPILIIILVAVLAGAGTWWYMNRQINQQKQKDTAAINELNQKVATMQSELDATKTAPQSTSATTDQQAISAQVQAMYKYWIDNKEKDINYLYKNGYITQAVVDQYNANKSVDLISCSQSTLTKSTDYQYSTPTVSGTTGTMKVSGVYAGPPPSTLVISLNNTKEGNVWKVSKITCPTQ